jgi:hypothetical protein
MLSAVGITSTFRMVPQIAARQSAEDWDSQAARASSTRNSELSCLLLVRRLPFAETRENVKAMVATRHKQEGRSAGPVRAR